MSFMASKKMLLVGKPPFKFVGGSVSANENAVPRPSGVAEGDLLVLIVSIFAGVNDHSVTPPSGFSLVGIADGQVWHFRIYTKRATGAEPATYAVNSSTEGRSQAMLCYRSARRVSIGPIVQTGPKTTEVALSMSLEGKGDNVAVFSHAGRISAGPSDMALRAQNVAEPGAVYQTYVYGKASTAGASGDKSATFAERQWGAAVQLEILR